METKDIKQGPFGPIYEQFKDDPKGAVKFLKKKKTGECTKAFYHSQIGYIDIIWGEVLDAKKHKGYGLAHIIDKHGADIEAMGYTIEDFISIVLQYGNLEVSKSKEEYLLQSDMFRVVIEKYHFGKPKNWILTAFVILQKKKSSRK
jgi:hypothetical protein